MEIYENWKERKVNRGTIGILGQIIFILLSVVFSFVGSREFIWRTEEIIIPETIQIVIILIIILVSMGLYSRLYVKYFLNNVKLAYSTLNPLTLFKHKSPIKKYSNLGMGVLEFIIVSFLVPLMYSAFLKIGSITLFFYNIFFLLYFSFPYLYLAFALTTIYFLIIFWINRRKKAIVKVVPVPKVEEGKL